MTAADQPDTPEVAWEEWARAMTDPAAAGSKPEALDGLVVLDLSRGNIGGMFCSSISPEFGPPGIRDSHLPAQALPGLPYMNGEMADPDTPAPSQVPPKAGPWLAWYVGGAWAAFGTAAALLVRGANGVGQLVDISPPEGVARFLDYNLNWYHAAGRTRERIGSLDLTVFPYTFVRCKDGYAFLAGFSDPSFAA